MPESGFTSSSSDAELRAHVERSLASSYELDREIGRGGMGIVYLARDRRLKRQVAIKLLPPELAFRSEIRTRFLREAETAAQLSHPNIVPIYSVDERDGLVYFVMAFVDGDTVASRLHARGPMPPDEVRHILIQTADALAYAHERGVVHRDIKPDNILLDRDDDRVMVTDFGIARAVTEGGDSSRLTATGMAIGTPAYMSPEQSMGERDIDGRSDLYSLGIVAYQMLTGELPFTAQSTPALLVKHISERPPQIDERCPSAPRDLARAIMLLLEKEPANRFPSAEALSTALSTRNVPAMPEAPAYLEERRGGGERYPSSYRSESPTSGASIPDREPTAAELRRWDAIPVVKYRKKLAPYVAFSSVSVILAITGVVSFMPVVGVWSVYLAYKYSQLWTEGYDWRDVLREPRDRMFFDVVADWFDNVRALYDRKKRAEVRERTRMRRGRPPLFASPDAPGNTLGGRTVDRQQASFGHRTADDGAIAQAARDRDDIVRLVHALPRKERELAGDVTSSAEALYQRVQQLTGALHAMAQQGPNEGSAAVDAEIARLEAEANPLDPRAEERVRRLARLRRDRRAIADISARRGKTKEKIESCLLALQTMRLDLQRLQAGGDSFGNVTLISERAMALAREIDNAVYAADEIRKLRDPAPGAGGRAR